MPVFFDTGGGDIYGGPTKEAVFAAIRADIGDEDFAEIENEIYEVQGTATIALTDENEEPTGQTVTLIQEYGDDTHAYCIASSNVWFKTLKYRARTGQREDGPDTYEWDTGIAP